MKNSRGVLMQSLLLLLLLARIVSACQPAPDKTKPNFLILISDDQRFDQLSYADHPIIPELRTPHLDQLAKQGIYFRNAFVTTPICAVSRACIMTGQYVSSHGMNHFKTPIQPQVLDHTYPALLHQNGYRTGILGKWGMGIAGTEKIFDVFDAWQNQGAYFHQTDSGRIHNSVWLAEKSRDFFESCEKDQPFCLTVCFKSPHHPYQPDPRDKALFENTIIPKRAADTEADYLTMAAHIMDSSLNRWCYFDERRDQEAKDRFEKNFLRCVVSLDRSIGEIMEYLKTAGLDTNTVTLFLSDHGYLWGEHGLGGKWLLYEESIRIPIIIQDPRLNRKNRGVILNQLALNIDLAPTILDLAGLEIPAEMNGISLMPTLTNHNYKTRTEFFMEHVGVIDVSNPIPDSRGVRTKDWKYIHYINVEPKVEELYNLKNDSLERHNLAADPAYQEKLKEMRNQYQSYLSQYDQL